MMRLVFQFLLLGSFLWIAACDLGPTGPSGSTPPNVLSDTGSVSRIPKNLLDLWLAPYDSGAGDSGLAGDFAPVAAGAKLEYYRSERYGKDTTSIQLMERISRLSQRVVKVEKHAVGNLITVSIVAHPVRSRVRYNLDGKSQEGEDAVDTSRRDSATVLYLERRGGFLVLDPAGFWRAARIGDEWLYHRVRKTGVQAEVGRFAPEKSYSINVGSTQAKYVTGVGMASFQAVDVSPGSDSQITTLALVAKDGKIYDDSLWADWARPIKPHDSSLLGASLTGLRDSLPPGFCTDAASFSPDTLDNRLGAAYDLSFGTTWEYLVEESGSSPIVSWMQGSGGAETQGFMRFKVDATSRTGACQVFSMEEYTQTKTRIWSHPYPYAGGNTVDSIEQDSEKVVHFVGVKRGASFYLLDRQAGAYQLLSRPPSWIRYINSLEGVLWPFPFNTQRAPGDTFPNTLSANIPPACSTLPASLQFSGDAQDSCLVPDSFDMSGFGTYRISSRFGLAAYAYTNYYTHNKEALTLFRYNGVVIDTAVFGRYLQGP